MKIIPVLWSGLQKTTRFYPKFQPSSCTQVGLRAEKIRYYQFARRQHGLKIMPNKPIKLLKSNLQYDKKQYFGDTQYFTTVDTTAVLTGRIR
jgi:hypothetical protein